MKEKEIKAPTKRTWIADSFTLISWTFLGVYTSSVNLHKTYSICGFVCTFTSHLCPSSWLRAGDVKSNQNIVMWTTSELYSHTVNNLPDSTKRKKKCFLKFSVSSFLEMRETWHRMEENFQPSAWWYNG